MVALAMESLFNGFSFEADSVEEMVYWQNWRLVCVSFLPAVWLFFSLSYGRGNYRDFLKKWLPVLIPAFLIPAGTAILFFGKLIFATSESGHWAFNFGISGFALNFLFLIGAILVLMNLERTFRASVGTMRWRIKFMILGLGVLFAVRIYTSSQALLFHSVELSLQTVNAWRPARGLRC